MLQRGRIIWLSVGLVLLLGSAVAWVAIEPEPPPTRPEVEIIAENAPRSDAPASLPSASLSSSATATSAPPAGGSPGAPTGPCTALPFTPSGASLAHATARKVWAFYFPPFPISIDNKAPTSDYYSTWVNSLNSLNGAYDLRDRPIGRPPIAGAAWKQEDFATEVRRARQVGIDGFIWEYNSTSSDARWRQLPEMLAAAKRVDPQFKIMLSPDMPSDAATGPSALAASLAALNGEPNLARTSDGRLLLAPFYPERRPVSWWDGLRDELTAKGVPSALVPIFLSWGGGSEKSEWTGHVYGYSTWGTRTASGTATYARNAQAARDRGGIWMQPAAFEDVRNYDGRYWEASNSGLLRSSFTAAIQSNADMMAFMTWNDYTESWMSPSRERGYSVTDVAAYYIEWFKMGRAPVVSQDALYYFHRSQRTDAPFTTSPTGRNGQKITMAVPNGDPPTNNVELVAFLAKPGTLSIRQGAATTTVDAAAGVVSVKAALVPGTTPALTLTRNGNTALAVTSGTPVAVQVRFQDMIYHGGGGTACPRA